MINIRFTIASWIVVVIIFVGLVMLVVLHCLVMVLPGALGA